MHVYGTAAKELHNSAWSARWSEGGDRRVHLVVMRELILGVQNSWSFRSVFLGEQTERWKLWMSICWYTGCIEVTFGKGKSDFPERSCEFGIADSHIEIVQRNTIPNERTGVCLCFPRAFGARPSNILNPTPNTLIQRLYLFGSESCFCWDAWRWSGFVEAMGANWQCLVHL